MHYTCLADINYYSILFYSHIYIKAPVR